MADIMLGCDINGNDAECQNTVAKILESGGNKVEKLAIDPNAFATASYDAANKDKIGVYLMADSIYSIGDFAFGGTTMKYAYFGIRGDLGLPRMSTQQDFDNNPLSSDPDCSGGVCEKISGKTYKQINEITKDRCQAVFGATPEELGNNILAAMGGQAQTGGSSSGGGAVLIPDKTFYGLIKQILGAVDAVFIIANNMAYLLSFKDLYKYRDQYEEYIPELQMSEIVQDSLIRHWTTSGLYNAVEVTYADGIIKYQYDALIEMYGENVFYYEFPEDDEETARAKANALLSAHVRDYSLDLQLNCIYNPNITVGSWIKIPKTLTKMAGATSQQTRDAQKNKKPQKVLRKGITIENMIEKTQKAKDGTEKNMQIITTEDGEKYDIEVNKKDYEFYFVQSYKLKWTPDHAPIMSLHLKYGPDTPEDPINATISTGESSSGGVSSAGSMFGDDCFGVETSQLYGDHRIPHDGSGGVKYATENAPSAEMTAGRCKQGSAYEKEVAGKTPQEAFYIASSKFMYCCYADNCSKFKCNDERWKSGECGFNCGDCATILKSVLDCVGTKNWIFHIDGHYHTMIDNGGQVQSVDLSRAIMSGGDSITHSVGWPVAKTGSCSCGCSSC